MSIRSLHFCLFGMCFLALSTVAYAAPAPPYPFTVEQPDGTSLQVTAEGDEFGMRVETMDGHTIVRGPGGWWEFAAAGANGSLVPSGIIPGQGDPSTAGIAHHLPLGAAELALARERRTAFARSRRLHPAVAARKHHALDLAGPAAAAPGGEAAVQAAAAALAPTSFRLAVLLIEFPWYQISQYMSEAAVPHTYAPEQIGDLLLSSRTYTTSPVGNPAYGSMRDYFETTSFGQFQLNGQVFPWVVADKGLSYYRDTSNGDALLRQEAIAKSGVDLSQFDGYVVIWAGKSNGFGNLWPHASLSAGWYMSAEKFNSGEDISIVGVHCHEFGHVLGLLDLYHEPNSVDRWGLMGSGSYGGGVLTGYRPVQLFSSDKEELGWVYPVTVSEGSGGTFTLRGWNDYPEAVKVVSQRSVFYLENRQKVGYDADLAGDGVLVLHVNRFDSYSPVDVEEADGVVGYDAGDPFPGTSGNASFACATTPATTDLDGTCSAGISGISVTGGMATFQVSVNWPSPGAGITIDGAGDYPTTFTAIQSAVPGQTVLVPAGIFTEPVLMRPRVNLRGEGVGRSILSYNAESYWMIQGAEDTTFSGFTIQGSPTTTVLPPGFSLGLGGGGTTRIANNAFVGLGTALYLMNFDSFLQPTPGSLVVANNIFRGNSEAIMIGPDDGALLLNNVFMNNRIAFYLYPEGTPSALVDYNDFYGNTLDFFGFTRRQVGRNNIYRDPLFRDAGGGDYLLLAGSSCINAGNADPAYDDLDGSRNDMGVFGGALAPAAPLSITTASLPAGYVGGAYSQTLAATGGMTPYIWSIAAGSLPAGLSLDATAGVISGTPAAGTSSFTVQVTDAMGTSATQAYSIQIDAASLPDLAVTAAAGPTSGTRGKKYTFSATVKNQGAANAGDSTLSFYLSTDTTITTSDIKLTDVSILSLAGGASKSVTSSVTLAASLATGTYSIGAIADRAGMVAESNEDNNGKTGNMILVK